VTDVVRTLSDFLGSASGIAMEPADESPLPLIASLQREIDEMLAVTRRETDEMRRRARSDASAYVATERVALAAAEQEAFDRAASEGEREVETARARCQAALTALGDRLARRHTEGVVTVVRVVTEDL
jgi:hypothetical protein